MQPFKINLSDGATITGLLSLPPIDAQARFVPLVVCLHGGSYDAEYFDATPESSIARVSDALHIPVIAINRPGYCETTPLAASSNQDETS
ncbi:hypothetical protein NUU61_007470 [Penicillium alfredii]|uniref:Uncharacterized protein n=1 Tax=Penicillium alfredii TaxID=1506179 RepID=A0A9W9F2U4_9EURO|nr:uncharacterized protein NUU61_007470 [Penicillium alfredii]KAJ5092600.1 hypothetical protein NUU61_007470 [Penicillium alfredii]